MLSDRDLSVMRSALEESLPDVVSILRNDPVSNGAGGQTDEWAIIAHDVPARISPDGKSKHGEDVAESSRLQSETRWIVTVAAFQDVTHRDRIDCGSGRVLEVSSIRAPRSFEISRVCECVEVQA